MGGTWGSEGYPRPGISTLWQQLSNPPESPRTILARRNDRRYLSHSFASRLRCALSFSRPCLSTNRSPYLAPPRGERQCVLSATHRDNISPREVVTEREMRCERANYCVLDFCENWKSCAECVINRLVWTINNYFGCYRRNYPQLGECWLDYNANYRFARATSFCFV